MKLGVVMDGISRDPQYAFKVMNETGIKYAEFQFVWDKEIGEHTPDEIKKLKRLTEQYDILISAIIRHNFKGFNVLNVDTRSSEYREHIEYLKKTIDIAHLFGTRNVRVLSCSKQPIIWGINGADQWVANNNLSWGRFLALYEEPLRIAEANDVDLIVETATNGMVTSGYLSRKFIDDMGSKHLKVLWDPANSLVCADKPYPDAYELIKDYIAEVHIKDAIADLPQATVEFCELGKGGMAPYLGGIAEALKRDYAGVVVLESVYRPENGTFEDGYRASLPKFKDLFA